MHNCLKSQYLQCDSTVVCENGLSRSNISSKQRVRYRSNSFSTMLKSVRGSLSYFKKDSNLSNKFAPYPVKEFAINICS